MAMARQKAVCGVLVVLFAAVLGLAIGIFIGREILPDVPEAPTAVPAIDEDDDSYQLIGRASPSLEYREKESGSGVVGTPPIQVVVVPLQDANATSASPPIPPVSADTAAVIDTGVDTTVSPSIPSSSKSSSAPVSNAPSTKPPTTTDTPSSQSITQFSPSPTSSPSSSSPSSPPKTISSSSPPPTTRTRTDSPPPLTTPSSPPPPPPSSPTSSQSPPKVIEAPIPPPVPEYKHFKEAAVSANVEPCAHVATDILRQNGTAADATIAAMICVGVMSPQAMGLGGGFLLTYYERSTRQAHTLISREMAPAHATKFMFHGDANLSSRGGLAIGIPGQVRGFQELYRRYGGGVPWADLFNASIALCENGHNVNLYLERALNETEDAILEEPNMRSIFVNPETGHIYQQGETMWRPQLAKTLRILQQEPDALYTGPLASQMAKDIQDHGGIISAEDLSNYRPVWKPAINVSLNDGNLTMFSVPPPGSGLILGFMLNILDEYDLSPRSLSPENELLTYHRTVEAMKWAYAKRTILGDPDFVDMSGLEANLTSDLYAAEIRRQIMDNQTYQNPEHYGANTHPISDHGTAQFSIVAPNGDAIAVTSTINVPFGSKVRSPSTGIIFNNNMDDFSSPGIVNTYGVPPNPENFIVPGKRPVSSMSPSVFVDDVGDARLVIGAAGGTLITTGVGWVTSRYLWMGEDIKAAIDSPRLHHQLFPPTLNYEAGMKTEVLQGLEKLGHQLDSFVACKIRAVARDEDGEFSAYTDPRRVGDVDGL